MEIFKYFMLLLILILSSIIGRILSKRYKYRLEELIEMKNALNMFESKIKFTYDSIPEVFEQIADSTNENISNIFKNVVEKIKIKKASTAWIETIDESQNYMKKEDKEVIKNLSKLLGQSDLEGQVSQIELTKTLLEQNIEKARIEKEKNVKLFNKLGVISGLVIVLILC